jgi:hypothetical protein
MSELVDCNYCFSKRPKSDANGPNCEGCFLEHNGRLSKDYKKLLEEYANMFQGEDEDGDEEDDDYEQEEQNQEEQGQDKEKDQSHLWAEYHSMSEEYKKILTEYKKMYIQRGQNDEDFFNSTYELEIGALEEGEYIVKGVLYASTFPKEMAGNHPNSGPKYCDNCAYFGCNENGAFVGFCLNCHAYNYPEGPSANFLH